MLPPRRSDDPADERGSAALEFLVGGLLLLVPLAYLVVMLGSVQEHALGVEAAARHAAHVLARSDGHAEGIGEVQRVIAAVAVEYGMDPAALEVAVTCPGAHSGCPEPGTTVVVTIAAQVPLPFIPPVLGLDQLASFPVEATSAQRVSRFWDGS
ncbi:TadE family protein [Microbacterium gilvum]|uniref:TadE family protein n=1 Tax=Microbacterium gilvum TaxID=1336204 RepID=UPI0031EDFFA7